MPKQELRYLFIVHFIVIERQCFASTIFYKLEEEETSPNKSWDLYSCSLRCCEDQMVCKPTTYKTRLEQEDKSSTQSQSFLFGKGSNSKLFLILGIISLFCTEIRHQVINMSSKFYNNHIVRRGSNKFLSSFLFWKRIEVYLFLCYDELFSTKTKSVLLYQKN